jgi:hypothetical protein
LSGSLCTRPISPNPIDEPDAEESLSNILHLRRVQDDRKAVTAK